MSHSPGLRSERHRYTVSGPDQFSSRGRHDRGSPGGTRRPNDGRHHAHPRPAGKSGFIERVRDSDDRRKVFARGRPEALAPLVAKHQALGKAYLGMIQDYSDSELMVILTYMEKMSGMAERLFTDVIAARSEG